MHKPELLVTPKKVEDIMPLIEAGADAFIIGEQKFVSLKEKLVFFSKFPDFCNVFTVFFN